MIVDFSHSTWQLHLKLAEVIEIVNEETLLS